MPKTRATQYSSAPRIRVIYLGVEESQPVDLECARDGCSNVHMFTAAPIETDCTVFAWLRPRRALSGKSPLATRTFAGSC